jgi:ankyrin repeat protein
MMKANKLWSDYTPLMKYAANGMLEMVERLCSESVGLNINEQKGWNKVNALMLAAQNNHVHVIKYLMSKGAEVDLVNSLNNSALMLAAEAGHHEAVIVLAETASITLSNTYGHTALILACEKGHLEVVKWIVTKDPSQVEVRNKYKKNCLLMAAEFGQYLVVKWLVENISTIKIDITNSKDVTPLMFAAGGGSERSCDIVKILIAKGADVNKQSFEKDTPIIWAAIGGNAAIIEVLNAAYANVNHANDKGFTALMKAAERGHHKACKALIDAGADMWKVVKDVSHHDKRMDAMKLAWMNGNVELATNLFMIPLDKELQMLSRNVTDIFNEDELEELAKKYANSGHFKSLRALVVLSCSYDFHFDLFVKLIPRFKTPNTVLNKQMIIMYITLFKQSSSFDVDLVHKLVQLAAAFAEAAANHPLEKIDLQDRINVIVLMLTECLNSDCMDDERNVQRILCASISKREDHMFIDDLVEQAQAFLRGPLETCISAKVTALFCTGHVSTYVDNLFWGFLRTKHGKNTVKFWFTPDSLLPFTRYFGREFENIRLFKSTFVHYRFSPAAMFFGEGISKIIFLFLVAFVAVQTRWQRVEYNHYNHPHLLGISEFAMLIMTVSMLLYEYGQLCGSTVAFLPDLKGIGDYLGDIWNCLDMSGLTLVSAYFILRYIYGDLDHSLETLSLSTIFFSVSNMRYLSCVETVGKLIIMVFAMMGELRSFAFIFIIFVFGFCVTLYCLLSDVAAFRTPKDTVVTLFSMSVQNYDSSFDLLVDKDFSGLALLVQVVYVLLTSVVLMNLIIARMSAIHGKIDDKSFEEWQYSRALTVQQFMVVEERSPFCMLPAPFNILPCIVFPIHAWLLSNAVRGITEEESVAAFFKSGGNTFKFAAAVGAGVVTNAVKFTAHATTTVVSTAANTMVNVGGAVADIGITSMQHAGSAALDPVAASKKLASGAKEFVHDPTGTSARSLKSIIHRNIATGTLEAMGAKSHLGGQLGDTLHSMEKFFAAAVEGDDDEDESQQDAPWLKKQVPPVVISLAGTVCDMQMGIIMAFVAPIIEYLLYNYRMIIKIFPVITEGKIHSILRSSSVTEYVLVACTFPFWYLPYVVALLLQVVVYSQQTKVQITRSDDSIKYVVQYEKSRRYIQDNDISLIEQPTDVDKLIIKVLRIDELNHYLCDELSNPVIRFRVGNYARVTGPSIYGGRKPAWSKEFITFPLRLIDLSNPILTYEVVDKDYMTGVEKHIADCSEPINMKDMIGNGSYEGKLELENGAGKIMVVIKVEFPSFLSVTPDPTIPYSSQFGLFKPSKNKDDDDAKRRGDGADDDDDDSSGSDIVKNAATDNSRSRLTVTERKRPHHVSMQLFSEVDKERIFMHALRPRNKQGYQSTVNYFPSDNATPTNESCADNLNDGGSRGAAGTRDDDDTDDDNDDQAGGAVNASQSPQRLRQRRRSEVNRFGVRASVSGRIITTMAEADSDSELESPSPRSSKSPRGKDAAVITVLPDQYAYQLQVPLKPKVRSSHSKVAASPTTPLAGDIDFGIGQSHSVSFGNAVVINEKNSDIIDSYKQTIQKLEDAKAKLELELKERNSELSRTQEMVCSVFYPWD